IRVRRRYGNRADGAGGLVVKDRLPGATVVVGLPHPAIAHANVKHVGLAGHAGDSARASATVGPDGAPVQGRRQECWRDRLKLWLLGWFLGKEPKGNCG